MNIATGSNIIAVRARRGTEKGAIHKTLNTLYGITLIEIANDGHLGKPYLTTLWRRQ